MTVEQLPLEVQEISKTLVLAPFPFKICKPTTNPAPQLPILYLHTVWPLEAKLCAENRLMFQLNTYCNYHYKFCYLWCLVCCKCHLLNQWPEAQYYRLVTSPRNSCQCVRYFPSTIAVSTELLRTLLWLSSSFCRYLWKYKHNPAFGVCAGHIKLC